jgi:hypothetical protein
MFLQKTRGIIFYEVFNDIYWNNLIAQCVKENSQDLKGCSTQ